MPRKVEVVSRARGFAPRAREVQALIRWLDDQVAPAAPPGAVHVAFVDAEESGELHGRFHGNPEPADVMTFPADEDDHAGDLAVCPAVAAAAARDFGSDPGEEVSLYLIHGYLHLAGRRDGTREDAVGMDREQQDLLERARAAGRLPRFRGLR